MAPSSIAAQLAHRAAATPRQPWLFFRGALDWRWYSWGDALRRTGRALATLADREAGETIVVDPALDPDNVILDLAVQAAGLCADPRAGAPRADPPRTDIPPSVIDPERAATGVVVARRGEDRRRFGQGELVDGAERVDRSLGMPWGTPIVLLHGTLDRLGVRLVLGWSIIRGVALALEADAELLAPAMVWTRPQFLIAPAELLPPLAERLAGERRRRLRRVTALGTSDDGGVADDPAESARWRALGARWTRLSEDETWSRGEPFRDPAGTV